MISATIPCAATRPAYPFDSATSLTCSGVPSCGGGIAELNGEGEVTGGIIVMRSGKNALTTLGAVKRKLEQLKPGLPPGVEIVPTYDRSGLIRRAVENLSGKIIEEFVVVALVCLAFLFHHALGVRGHRLVAARHFCWRSSSCISRA